VRCAAACVLALAFAPTAAAAPFTLELTQPPAATYGDTIALRGRIVPALVGAPVTISRDGAPVGTATSGADGTFVFRARVGAPATYSAVAGELASAPVALAVRPRLTARVVGAGVVGQPLRLEARVEPAGPLQVEVRRGRKVTLAQTFAGTARVGLTNRAPHTFRISLSTTPPAGWLAAARSLTARTVQPRLALGSHGAGVLALERRLRELHFALQRVDARYDLDTYQAVLAFQKVNGLPWTGRTDARVWRALARAHVPFARYRGTHIEVSKARQYLLLVRNGRVQDVVHISTGATGNTPIGRWHVYRKVVGWDWILWYPMYFLRGFAIHGYPSVPAYPASHGCVRVPMWIAPKLFAQISRGQTIYVY
jgi:L,D-transpeptidase catalytic domain/Putative peptidoglycan binding domain